ncbi:hypothetical protein SACE_7022 [Saccharopolyspora erythraea prophage pSE211]|uniref:Uncharacterized protein n=1 Tax=Saccharopolyspora erythraea (strain ATCC 11635 / DSM 40517 / JCM 4748 / NBRC 13426 / NCIMB 8594 / NRRL 2338) TaxID=405948 RepID=A4FQ58_SACEN|nr:hypothetical protein SACE_7022 [Saccharopolyspora erythraea NRRL 2338]
MPVDELLPQARQLADDLGTIPPRNRLMSELKIGAPKANALLDKLKADPDPATARPAGLHLVAEGRALPESTTEPDPVSDAPAEPAAPTPSVPGADPATVEAHTPAAEGSSEQVTAPADPGTPPGEVRERKAVSTWPVLLLALPAFVAIWSGWVGLGGLTGFGIVHPLPGIWDEFELNTAITLPIGVETYAAYALRVWLSGQVPARARHFAKVSALGSLALGALGQIAYHLMTAAGMTAAPWWITTIVACLPVAVLGMGAALTHLLHTPDLEVTR